MQSLKSGSFLQGGKYRIESTLGQGGFGITYVAVQVALNRRVSVKEFFMKDFCDRDADTSHVTLGTSGSAETVSRFREKFIKEARMIASFDHLGIVRVLDVFEENGTAYYVMDYIPGGSLSDKVKQGGPLPESQAGEYIRQVSDALAYIHAKNTVHLDVKPSNILLNAKGNAVLIDFGISKHYDESGSQTSSTPVGLSKGYTPLEQGRDGDVSQFRPSTDIYALGATLYYLVTGKVPLEASVVYEEGLDRPSGISDRIWNTIQNSMRPRRKDRPQCVADFLTFLNEGILRNEPVRDEETEVSVIPEPIPQPVSEPKSVIKPRPLWPYVASIMGLFVCIGLGILLARNCKGKNVKEPFLTDSIPLQSQNVTPTIQTFTAKGVSFNMVLVDGGTFTMGATSEQGSDAANDEKPAHQVTLSTYHIGETEVTQELWQAVMGSNPSKFKGSKLPVENVSWDDCQTFITKLNRLTGKTFRLPTEAEWEFAARGGNQSKGYKYSGSNTIGDVAWYDSNSGSKTHDVGTKAPNELGIYDMSGNVWEWCQDRYGSYSSSSQTNPAGPSLGSIRVPRGGSWGDYARFCRVSIRSYVTPVNRSRGLGLRLAL